MAEESMSETPKQASSRLVILAHPDDAEFTVAGTVARWVKEGSRVVYVVCTDGSRGSNDPVRADLVYFADGKVYRIWNLPVYQQDFFA
jgi:LmbE family N-acetylglucosaminyl deacetylase